MRQVRGLFTLVLYGHDRLLNNRNIRYKSVLGGDRDSGRVFFERLFPQPKAIFRQPFQGCSGDANRPTVGRPRRRTNYSNGDVSMATPANFRTGILTAALAICFATIAIAQSSESESGLSSVPSNAVAFVHFDVVEMLSSPGMAVPTEIAAGVKQEADELFERHLGVQISELQTVTLVAPTMESLMTLQTSDIPNGFGLFAFAEPVKTNFVKNLPGTWRPTNIGENTFFVEQSDKLAIFHSTANTVAFGSEDGIRWFIEHHGNRTDNGLRPSMQLAQSGHVTIGINGDALPSEMKMFLPPEWQSFADAKSAAINLDFTNGIAARVQMNFNSEQDAGRAVASAQQNFEKVRMVLKDEESNAQGQFKDESDDLAAAIIPLSRLALIRYGDKILQRATIEQINHQLQAHLAIEGFDGQMLVITCLTAIQAIGSSSEAEFQSIADDLDRMD